MKISNMFFVVVLFVAFLLGYYFRGWRITQPPTQVVYDTVTVTRAEPVYYTKYVPRITHSTDTVVTVDTVYVASLDTTINDITLQVEYESPTATTGSFNISAISMKPVYIPPDYYMTITGISSFVSPLRTITFDTGKYILRFSRLSLGMGGYITYYHSNPLYKNNIDYGLQLKLQYEF